MATLVTVFEVARLVVVLNDTPLLVAVVADADVELELELLLPGSVRFDKTTAGCEYSQIVIPATVLLFTPVVVVNDEAFKQLPLLHDWTAVCTHPKLPALFTATPKIFCAEVEFPIGSFTHRCT
jgi:hypothetical protein